MIYTKSACNPVTYKHLQLLQKKGDFLGVSLINFLFSQPVSLDVFVDLHLCHYLFMLTSTVSPISANQNHEN